MAKEIERKFLVNTALWRAMAAGTRYRQGYLSSVKERVVRVRIAGDRGFLTIKGLTTGVSRLEFEYPIPLADATCDAGSALRTTAHREDATPRGFCRPDLGDRRFSRG